MDLVSDRSVKIVDVDTYSMERNVHLALPHCLVDWGCLADFTDVTWVTHTTNSPLTDVLFRNLRVSYYIPNEVIPNLVSIFLISKQNGIFFLTA